MFGQPRSVRLEQDVCAEDLRTDSSVLHAGLGPRAGRVHRGALLPLGGRFQRYHLVPLSRRRRHPLSVPGGGQHPSPVAAARMGPEPGRAHHDRRHGSGGDRNPDLPGRLPSRDPDDTPLLRLTRKPMGQLRRTLPARLAAAEQRRARHDVVLRRPALRTARPVDDPAAGLGLPSCHVAHLHRRPLLRLLRPRRHPAQAMGRAGAAGFPPHAGAGGRCWRGGRGRPRFPPCFAAGYSGSVLPSR